MQQGFTLVEIMVVIAILGLLLGIGVPAWQRSRHRTLEQIKVNNARVVADAVERWAVEYGKSGTATVQQSDIEAYLKGGWQALRIGTMSANWPANATVDFFSSNLSDIANAMYD